MSKIGFINDVVRGIKKVVGGNGKKTAAVSGNISTIPNANTAPLLERAFLFLEDGDWNSADDYCEKVLDIDPKCARAYLGKLMAELKVNAMKDLQNCNKPFADSLNYQKVIRFADDNLKNRLTGYIATITERIEEERLATLYASAKQKMDTAKTTDRFLEVAEEFKTISEYKNAGELAMICYEKAETVKKEEIAETIRKNNIYTSVKDLLQQKNIESYEEAIEKLKTIPGWKNSDDLIPYCEKCIEEEREQENRVQRIAFLSLVAFIFACFVGSYI